MSNKETNKEKISVVIPLYNKEKYIKYTIESVLTQSYSNLEIIVVNDKSTDNSIPIINSIDDERIKVINLKNNSGPSKARNIGIKKASGKYLSTLDADDIYLSPVKLEKELKVIKENGGIGFSNIALLTESGYSSYVLGDKNIKSGNIFQCILKRSCFVPRDFLAEKELYRKAGYYDEKLSLYEDWDLKLRLAKISSYYYSGVIGIGYRQVKNGLSSVEKPKHKAAQAYIRDKVTNKIRINDNGQITW